KEPGKVMIYPTPAKQNSSLGSPYADLFREFQSRIVREQSVLFTMGYACGDEHINNIIYQALTIPTFRLVIVVDPDLDGEIEKLRALNDPRIWIIGGAGRSAGRKAHYFDTII
ncbi:SIR2 family protein, partial [Escherichia coli]|nr:SIR2 family protein [Escherichia coli]